MRVMGVLGGLGPDATLDFFGKVLRRTGATTDQEHLPILIHNDPRIPSRNDAMAGTGPSPGPGLVAAAQSLQRAGADFLVMPCNAAHHWLPEITAAVDLPFLSIVDVTVAATQRLGVQRVGVLAADSCMKADLYPPALRAAGLEVALPTQDGQRGFMELLAQIKAGDTSPPVRQGMAELASALRAEAVVAGCTEIPLVLSDGDVPFPVVASTDELVEAAIAHARS
ncbi:MAG: amino acid racemase [Myxococcales bacterium]|nr:amino acid racemase [Myxococcales bacterium]